MLLQFKRLTLIFNFLLTAANGKIAAYENALLPFEVRIHLKTRFYLLCGNAENLEMLAMAKTWLFLVVETLH